MALRRAGLSLTIEGQAEYKAGLAEINREQRLMSEQSRLAVAQLGTQASRQQTYSTQMNNYGKQIETASTKVQTLVRRQKELPGVQSQLSNSIKSTNDALRYSSKETDRLKNNYDQMRKALGSNHEETQKAKAAYQASRDETKLLGTEIKNLEKAYNSNQKELSDLPFSLNKADLATQQLRNEAQKLHDEYRNAGGRLAETADNYRKFGSTMNNVGGQMQNIGDKLTTGITLPLMGLTAAALTVGITFEQQMSRVGAIAGATAEELEQLTAQAKDLGASTAFSASEVAQGMENMASAGFATTEILAAMPGVLDLAAVSGGDVALASEAAATAVRTFGLEASDTGHVANVFARAAADTNAEVADMAEAMKYAAPMANTLGMSIEDTAAAIGIMSDAGIKGSTAGTTLRGAFTRLAKPTEAAYTAMWELGIEMFNAEGNMKTMAEVVAELQDGLVGMTSEQKASTLATIFGQEAMSGMMTLVEAGPDKVNALSESFTNSAGAAEEMAKKMQDNVAGDIEEMMGSIETAGIVLTEALAPIIRDLAVNITELVGEFNELDEESQKQIITWLAMAAAAGPVLSTLGKVTSGVGTLTGATGDLIQWFGKVSTPKTVGGITTALSTVGGGATTTATQVGALSTTIGGLPIVLGVAGAALLGWTAWKVWGEDAWNAAQRTREWGVDVGETVDNTLTEFTELNQSVIGQMTLMAQGLSGSTEGMSANFASMGEVIETGLKERISKLDKLIAGLPDTVRTSLEKILEEDKQVSEESLTIVEENNARIAEIREQASQHNRELSIIEANMISNLNKESSEAYVNTLKISQQEKQQILDAMNGDVEKASQEEARIWAESLAKQRQEQTLHYAEQKQQYLEGLKELGYSPDFIAEHEKIWDAAHEATTNGIDQQLATIAEKYPEIAEQILFSNGQTAASMGATADEMREYNQNIIDSATNMSAQVAANAARNAEKLRWVADEATFAGATWNSVVLDEKTGEVKTNVREAIVEAGSDLATWNDMTFMLHEANIDSNAKTMIGEAAIVNGRWDNMSWSDKQLILKDNFSITMYQALEETGKWNELSVEQKTAYLYSNTPEMMAQTMLDLGLWEEFQPQIKSLYADNYEILNAIAQSETALSQYNEAPVELKTLLANDPSTLTFDESRKALEAYNALPEDLKVLLGNNSDAMAKIQAAQDRINNYNQNVHPGPKHLHATSDVEGVVYRAQIALDGINGKIATTYIDTVRREWSQNSAGGVINWATGTNYHPGGPMVVNDQKGPLFQELVAFPNGTSFIPEGRNVFIPNAPRGAKVLKAALTKNLIPKYEKGIGFDEKQLVRAATTTNNVERIVEKPEFHIHITAYGDLPRTTIKRMAKDFEQELKRNKDSYQLSIGKGSVF